MIALPSFAFLARALVLVVDRSWAVTASSLCLQAVAVAPRVLGPGRPSTLDHTSRVVRRCGKIRRGAVLLNFLVSGTICATVGCWRVVAVPALCLLARRLPVLVVAARAPRAPASPIPIHWWIICPHLIQNRR